MAVSRLILMPTDVKFSDTSAAVDMPAKHAVTSGGISFTSIFGNSFVSLT